MPLASFSSFPYRWGMGLCLPDSMAELPLPWKRLPGWGEEEAILVSLLSWCPSHLTLVTLLPCSLPSMVPSIPNAD